MKPLHGLICILLCLTALPAAAQPRLEQALAKGRWIAYTPRSYASRGHVVDPATAAGIRADLAILKPHFDGLITYACTDGIEQVAAIAAQQGFAHLIIGIWDPQSETERQKALAAAKAFPALVVGVAIGNEGLFGRRYTAADVAQAAAWFRLRAPVLALTSSEPFFLYLKPESADWAGVLDFFLPNVHPLWEPWFKGSPLAAQIAFVPNAVDLLRQRWQRPVLVKETGLPSGPAGSGFSVQSQADFWQGLWQALRPCPQTAVAGFEAFDAPWKPAELEAHFGGTRPEEAFWGFYDAAGRPKPVVKALGSRIP